MNVLKAGVIGEVGDNDGWCVGGVADGGAGGYVGLFGGVEQGDGLGDEVGLICRR